MKNRKRLLLFLTILGALLLSACGRSDITLTVNGDGSFHADVTYSIIREMVANDEALASAKALITDSLDQSGIPYTETEDEDYVKINVERDFADLEELTSKEAWRGIGFVPSFTANNDGTGIWTRYDEGRLKFSGTLNSETFNAQELLGDIEGTSYGGSLRIVLPQAAEAFVGGQMEDGNSYFWNGSAKDSLALDLATQPMFETPGVTDVDSGGAANTGTERRTTLKDGLLTALVVLVIIALAAVIILAAKRKNKDA